MEFLYFGFQEEVGFLKVLNVLVLHLIDSNCFFQVILSLLVNLDILSKLLKNIKRKLELLVASEENHLLPTFQC